ncbi:SVM family protein ['Fragaria x ananassa' phyllody phytoplasma]|uniref:SVM family protein n=1 Tax='Fragaria x ananassa' phyllody phytoplasma TaxID=2358428 RepID=A0ABS5K3Q6_9MOLU|nr:SVM family protein ['Fragaria x ananassa' phyllody phytoplasma]MBS2126551.1 SVM family protein ['Fragaria x ananassa' phyllody phytoplasma]
MVKLKNQFKIIHLCLIISIGFFFKNQVMAMNNDELNNNNNVYNSLEEYRNYQSLLTLQQTKAQEVINAFENQISEEEKNILLSQFEEIHRQIITTQQRHLNIQQQINRNLILNIRMIELEHNHSSLVQEMETNIVNTPLFASEQQINLLRNTQIRINQNQASINEILEQIRNQLSSIPRINLSRNTSSRRR